MNPLPFPTPLWRRHLDALPDAAPPDTLWPRLAAAYAARRRRRQRPWWVGGAVAAAAVLALAGGLDRAPARPDPAPAAPPPQAAARADDADRGLRRLDDEIALAYARGAGEAELAMLWETRARLMDRQDQPAPVLARL